MTSPQAIPSIISTYNHQKKLGNILIYIAKRKYEFLLLGLLQHAFIGIFLKDMSFYTTIIWPVNMVVLVASCYAVFWRKGSHNNLVLGFLTLIVCCLPIFANRQGFSPALMEVVSVVYVLFFAYVFYNLMRFLIRPGYINTDVISAAVCGYLLLIEILTFLMQTLYYQDTTSFKGIDVVNAAAAYIDFVYFATITLTSIGYGDILPTSPQMKLLVAFFGLIGQFYSVVLVGILISKFTSRDATP